MKTVGWTVLLGFWAARAWGGFAPNRGARLGRRGAQVVLWIALGLAAFLAAIANSVIGSSEDPSTLVEGFQALLKGVASHADSWQLVFAANPDPAVADRYKQARALVAKQVGTLMAPGLRACADSHPDRPEGPDHERHRRAPAVAA